MVVVIAGVLSHAGRSHGGHLGLVAADVLFIAAVFFAVGKLNARGAEKLQRQIEELDEQGRG